ncbi:hypothetical protein [Halomarina ordinaria]|uniref:Uncharacterized protein n=1 Tax=Halomarina ordinaria TaxID=3033939 RepID=A0ABD5U766_9EURY|nr:hypothetical protein [Halomarina sp. PSRA2]
MQFFGTPLGTALWALIGVGTAALAVTNGNRVTAVIATGWLALAVFSFYEYRKGDG